MDNAINSLINQCKMEMDDYEKNFHILENKIHNKQKELKDFEIQFKQHLNNKSKGKQEEHEDENKNSDSISNGVIQTKSSVHVNRLLCDESIASIEIKGEININQFVGQFIDKINISFSLKRENRKVKAKGGTGRERSILRKIRNLCLKS